MFCKERDENVLSIIFEAVKEISGPLQRLINQINRTRSLSAAKRELDELKTLRDSGKVTQKQYAEAETRYKALSKKMMLDSLSESMQTFPNAAGLAKRIRLQNEEIRASKIERQQYTNSEYVHKNYGLGSDNS